MVKKHSDRMDGEVDSNAIIMSGNRGKKKANSQVHKQSKTIKKNTKLSKSQKFHSSDQMDGEVDSNAIIMPGKREKKDKSQRGTIKENAKLSKSQKRKLRKLEEDKEKDLLMAKSMETLEKYKLPDNVYSLMLSSGNIGQSESVREKRRREVQFSKMGLSVPQTDRHVKAVRSREVEHESARSQSSTILETATAEETGPESADKFVSKKDFFRELDESATTAPVEKIPLENSCISIQQLNQESMPKLSKGSTKEPERLVDELDGSQNMQTNSTSNPEKVQLQKVQIAPVVVHVSRPEEVKKTRKDLPIVMMEQEIMEAINENNAVIICGETGCGKTTQVPQFLYEAGFGSEKSTVRSGIIGVTQPRRVAVLATAKRVAFELGLRLGKEVGFQVRHDCRVGDRCSIKFMTDGILLREVQNDFLLKKYSMLILDEAHERSLNTDILIGMLSRVIQQRQAIYEEQQHKILSGESISSENKIFPLKLVLMSATLRVEDFVSNKRIFRDPPPVIEVPTRQFPVTVHFSKRTEIVDYIGQAYKKVLAIHKRLPPGGILVFVTGQREVEYLCKKLRNASKDLVERNSRRNMKENEVSTASSGTNTDESDMKEMSEAFDMQGHTHHEQTDRFSSYDDYHDEPDEDDSDFSDDSATDSDLDGVDEDGDALSQKIKEDTLVTGGKDVNLGSLKAAFEALAGKTTLKTDIPGGSSQLSPTVEKGKDESSGLSPGAMTVLPLYAMLPASAQLHVFDDTKEGERLVVVATNVAETSLTIPGIKYVVDTGREKVKQYNSSNGMESYEVQWISKASASQRAGRAGRTAPGHCYRLYSAAVFSNTLPDFSPAEISKTPVDGVVLLMKSIGIDKVINFPFPTPPEVTALVEAERCLKALEALETNGRLTPLGRAMVRYPMSPRHSRMLLTVIKIMRKVKDYARANLVFGYTLAAAAALSLQNPFIMQFEGSHTDAEESVTGHSKKRTDEEKLKKKQLKESVKLARASFSNPTSDALTIAYALQCFELAKSPNEFCSKNALHLKTMEEMSKLRKQLLQLVFNQSFCGIEQEFSWTHGTVEDIEHAWRTPSNKNPLLLNEEELLGQAICAGWADRVAKRMRGASTSDEDWKTSATRYQACMVKETVFLHRRSSVSRSAPEFVVYNELLHSRRPYIHGATSVKPDWLVKYAGSLCTFSSPLGDPKPYYDPSADQVFCWVLPTFGPHLWQLPLHNVPIKDDFQRVGVFACSLLEGHVLPCLRSAKKFLAAPPSSIMRPEASGHKRVGNLVNKLKTRSRIIDTCAKLREAWDENPRELYVEILGWFQEGFSDQFEELWSEMHHEVLLSPKERYPKRVKRDKKDK